MLLNSINAHLLSEAAPRVLLIRQHYQYRYVTTLVSPSRLYQKIDDFAEVVAYVGA